MIVRTSFFVLASLALAAAGCGGQESGSTGGATPAVSTTAPSGANAATRATQPAAASNQAVARCLDLARQEAWAYALTPCTQAAQQAPDDVDVQNALEQARAAAAEAAAEARGMAQQGADEAAGEATERMDEALGQ